MDSVKELRNILLAKYHKARERDVFNKDNGINFPSAYDAVKDAVKDVLNGFKVTSIEFLKTDDIQPFYDQIKNL